MAAAAPAPTWPAISDDHPLYLLHAELAPLFSETPPHKIWGITLSPNQDHFLTKIILQKFLRANKGNKELAKRQLEDTLKWRGEYFDDDDGKVNGNWDRSKFQDLAYITKETVKDGGNDKNVIVTWNIYGNVKDFAKTFGDVEEFLRWRVDLMERSIKLLDLSSAKLAIPDYSSVESTVDPYQAIQVHDYLQISFFRTPADVRNASKKTIELFQSYYPELLEKKFFVNVPVIMGWVYTAMKALIAKETFKKLTMLSYGEELAKHMGSSTVPTVYGGTGGCLEKTQILFPEAETYNEENIAKEDVTETGLAQTAKAVSQVQITAPETASEAKVPEDASQAPASTPAVVVAALTPSDIIDPAETIAANERENK